MMTELFVRFNLNKGLMEIGNKVFDGSRISSEEALLLYQQADLGFLACLANHIKEKLHGNKVFFNKNIHIEPTNLCVFDCKFCSYSRLLRQKGDSDAWEMTEEEMINKVKDHPDQSITEVHIVGGVHPKMDLKFFGSIIKKIKTLRPDLHIKAFTAVELEYMFRKAKVSFEKGLEYLKECGLDSIPGGGAEIFDSAIREKICADKCSTAQWLEIHETAHRLGIPSNATMLYGHIENYSHRIDHMMQLRDLQDRTHGFNAFIPLKFRNENNQMSDLKEISVIEDLKNYAVSRIFMDNFPHIKAYWPMIGREVAQMSLNYGVDDIDGTIDDTTKIYSMAGSEEQHPAMTTKEMVKLIKAVERQPVERDTLYNAVFDYS